MTCWRSGERPPLNVHPSLLPRHRGAAPVASTILAGDPEAGGVSLMVMTPELDAGPIVAQWPVPLTGRETTPELEARLAELAADGRAAGAGALGERQRSRPSPRIEARRP